MTIIDTEQITGANPLLGERETTLTYQLEPSPHGTLVTLGEEGFIGRPEAAYGNRGENM